MQSVEVVKKNKHKGKGKRGKGKGSRKKPRLTAASADRHALYEEAVQDAAGEVELMFRLWDELIGGDVTSLREDFCGTAWICAEWVKSNPNRTAIGVDLNKEVLDWGRERHIGALDQDAAKRVSLYEENVLTAVGDRTNIIAALNYSYFIFKKREELKQYFRLCYERLDTTGFLVMDAYGGSDAQVVLKEKRRCKGFTYIWEQASYNPIDSHVLNHIHFRFRDKTKLKRAFTYDWRLWQLGEIKELLLEVGFDEATVYWDQEDEDGESTGEWAPALEVENDPGWNAYIVGLKR